jgi:hypothetical protein
MRKNKLLVLLSMAIILSLSMMPSVHAASEDNTTQSEGISFPKDKYFLFEYASNTHGIGNVGNQMMIDGPIYKICSSPLQVQDYVYNLSENTVVLWANKITRSGSAGGGIASGISAYDSYSYSDSDGNEWNVEADGTLNLKYEGKWIKLAIGETFEDTQDITPKGCTVQLLWTATITNYGFMDKSNVFEPVYSTQPTSPNLEFYINDPCYTEKGVWTSSTGFYLAEDYITTRTTKTIGSTAKWSFTIPADGNYEIGFLPGISGAKYEIFQSGELIDENYFQDYSGFKSYVSTPKVYQLKKGARISVKVTLTEGGKELSVGKLLLQTRTNWIRVPSVPLYIHGESGKLIAKDCKSDMFTYDSELDCISSCDDGDYVSIPVNYGSGLTVPELLLVNAAIPDNSEEKAIEIRLDAVDGKLLGTMVLDTTGSESNFQNQSKFFDNLKTNTDSSISRTGSHEIFLVFKGCKDIGNFKSFEVTWADPDLGSNYWSYTVKGPELPKTPVGDVDSNSKIDAIDLAYMTKYLLGKISDLPADNAMWAADINEDDSINSIDSGYLRKYLLDIITQFPKY